MSLPSSSPSLPVCQTIDFNSMQFHCNESRSASFHLSQLIHRIIVEFVFNGQFLLTFLAAIIVFCLLKSHFTYPLAYRNATVFKTYWFFSLQLIQCCKMPLSTALSVGRSLRCSLALLLLFQLHSAVQLAAVSWLS